MAAFSWDSPTFGMPGHNVHESAFWPDRHDIAEQAAEDVR